MKERVGEKSTSNWRISRGARLALVLAGCTLLFRLRLVLGTGLFQDEALYAWLARNLPVAFSPHPPGTPLLVLIGTGLMGRNELGVRLLPMLLTTLTFLPFWLLAKHIAGEATAVWATIAFAAVPMYFGFGAITTPDGVQLLLWTTALYFTWRAIEGQRAAWWIAAGLSVGVGLYVKYIMVLYFPALALYFLLSRQWRQALRNRGLWLGGALALAVFLPVAAWCEHAAGWPAVKYHLHDRQELTGPSLTALATYLLVHLGYYSPVLYVGALAGTVICGVRGMRERDRSRIFLFSFAALPWLFFAFAALMTRRELSREQWDAPAYVTALIAASMMARSGLLDSIPSPRRALTRGLVIAAPALGIATILFLVAETATGFASGALGKRPLFLSMVGWQTMAKAADARIAAMPEETPVFVLGNSFIPAMQYAFYSSLGAPAYTLVHSANSKYGLNGLLDRGKMSMKHLGKEEGHNAIFVAEEIATGGESRGPKENEQRQKKLLQYFSSVEETPPVEVVLHGKVVKLFRFYRCMNLRSLSAQRNSTD
jgi:4-amino-4-deoxy-L-arabinose transferase-like glycosyltransferase